MTRMANNNTCDNNNKQQAQQQVTSVLESLIDELPASKPGTPMQALPQQQESPKMLQKLLSGADQSRIRNSSDLLRDSVPSPPSSSSSPISNDSVQLISRKTEALIKMVKDLRETSEACAIPYKDLVEVLKLGCSNSSSSTRDDTTPAAQFQGRVRSETMPTSRSSQDLIINCQEGLLAQLMIEPESELEEARPPERKVAASVDFNVHMRKRSITHHLWPLTSRVKLDEGTVAESQLLVFRMIQQIFQILLAYHKALTHEQLLAVIFDDPQLMLEETDQQSKLEYRTWRFLQRVWAPLFVLLCVKTNFKFCFVPVSTNAYTGHQHQERPSLAFAQNLAEFIQTHHGMNISAPVFDAILQVVITQVAYPDFCLVSYSVAMSLLQDRVLDKTQFLRILLMLNQLACFDDVSLRGLFNLQQQLQSASHPSPMQSMHHQQAALLQESQDQQHQLKSLLQVLNRAAEEHQQQQKLSNFVTALVNLTQQQQQQQQQQQSGNYDFNLSQQQLILQQQKLSNRWETSPDLFELQQQQQQQPPPPHQIVMQPPRKRKAQLIEAAVAEASRQRSATFSVGTNSPTNMNSS